MNAKAKPPVAKATETIEMGWGNVFADLGLPQAAAAKRLGIAQPHVSELKNYKLGRFSSERLLHYITLMNWDVEIFIRPRTALPVASTGAGAVTVWAAA